MKIQTVETSAISNHFSYNKHITMTNKNLYHHKATKKLVLVLLLTLCLLNNVKA